MVTVPLWLFIVLGVAAGLCVGFGWWARGRQNHIDAAVYRAYRNTPMTPEQRKAFNAAFGHMDSAFAEMDKAFATPSPHKED